MLVKNLMTKEPMTCHSSDMLNAAAQIMWDADCGAVPIIDVERHVVGFVTDRDICMAAYTQGRPLAEIPIAVAMARQVFTCAADDPIEAAEEVMRKARVRRLPVVDAQGQLVGLLSLNDLAREAGQPSQKKEAPQSADLTQTLAAICSPRRAAQARGSTPAA